MTARTLAPFDPVAVAAWTVGDGPRGVLMIHGFAGTPPELRGLGDYLAAQGFTCHAPTLAGHGLTPEDLAATTWQDWVRSASQGVAELRQRCASVAVVGQSMGGTIALHLAASDPGMGAVATLAAPVFIRSRVARLLPVLKYAKRWHLPGGDIDLYRREGVEELHSYGRRSTSAINELFKFVDVVADELACIRQPVLLMHGHRDSVIDPANLPLIRSRLVCSSAVASQLYPRSGHSISVDVDSNDVNQRVAAWLQRYMPGADAADQSTSGNPSSVGKRSR